MTTTAELTGSNNFAGVICTVVTGTKNLDLAHLTDGKRIFQQERNPADGRIARRDFVSGVCQGTVENGQSGGSLNRPAVVTPSVNGCGAQRQCGRWADGIAVTHVWVLVP